MTLHIYDFSGPNDEPVCVREEIIGQPNVTGHPTTIATGEATTLDKIGDCTSCGEAFLWGGARTLPSKDGCKCCDECSHPDASQKRREGGLSGD